MLRIAVTMIGGPLRPASDVVRARVAAAGPPADHYISLSLSIYIYIYMIYTHTTYIYIYIYIFICMYKYIYIYMI